MIDNFALVSTGLTTTGEQWCALAVPDSWPAERRTFAIPASGFQIIATGAAARSIIDAALQSFPLAQPKKSRRDSSSSSSSDDDDDSARRGGGNARARKDKKKKGDGDSNAGSNGRAESHASAAAAESTDSWTAETWGTDAGLVRLTHNGTGEGSAAVLFLCAAPARLLAVPAVEPDGALATVATLFHGTGTNLTAAMDASSQLQGPEDRNLLPLRVFSVGVDRETGGKDPVEALDNTRRRHASGTFTEIVSPVFPDDTGIVAAVHSAGGGICAGRGIVRMRSWVGPRDPRGAVLVAAKLT
jgi:hypothetical protein